MSTIDFDKPVHLIVHGQRDLIDSIRQKLTSLGFADNKLIPASSQKTGNICEITGINQAINQAEAKDNVMGAWSNVSQKEISRIPLP